LQLRAEAGAVFAPAQARVPATVLFRTGGDTTVRGYSLREIGVRQDDGSVAAGHTLAVASVEWLRPLRSGGRSSLWEQALSLVDITEKLQRPKYQVIVALFELDQFELSDMHIKAVEDHYLLKN
jgi:translocation and assembly module TamA